VAIEHDYWLRPDDSASVSAIPKEPDDLLRRSEFLLGANSGLREDASEISTPHPGRSSTRLNHRALMVAPDDVLAEDKESINGRT
jgi:hypothetical protein